MSSNLPLTDDLVRELFERRAAGTVPADLAATIADLTGAQPQRRHWWDRLRPTPGRSRRAPLVIAIALLAAVAIGGAVFVVAGQPAEPESTPAPSPTELSATPPAPSLAGDLIHTTFVGRQLEYRLTPKLDLVRVEGSGSMMAFVPGGRPNYERTERGDVVSGARGIVVASTRSAVTHPCPMVDGGSSRVPVREAPEAFLEDLRAIGGAGLTDPMATVFDGRPALEVRLDLAANQCQAADFHVSGGGLGSGYVLLSVPTRLTLTQVEDWPIAVQVWAATDEDLEAWLPEADEFLKTIHFP